MDMKLIPRISEKSLAHVASNKYTFNVPLKANKEQIATAIAKQFGVEVMTVNVIVAKGKAVRSFRKKGGAPVSGKRSDVKKAYVTLAEGQVIPGFQQETN